MGDDERRAAARKMVNFSVLYRTGLRQYEAVLVNISLTGALFECSTVVPPAGAIVLINFTPPEQGNPITLNGRVARFTPRGFAVQFLSVTEEIQQLVERLK